MDFLAWLRIRFEIGVGEFFDDKADPPSPSPLRETGLRRTLSALSFNTLFSFYPILSQKNRRKTSIVRTLVKLLTKSVSCGILNDRFGVLPTISARSRRS